MILESNDPNYQKSNLKEFTFLLKTLVEYMSSNNTIKLKMQTIIFEKILRIIEIFISKQHISSRFDSFEKTLASLNFDIQSYLMRDEVKKVETLEIYFFNILLQGNFD